jgi:hypothetical protein
MGIAYPGLTLQIPKESGLTTTDNKRIQRTNKLTFYGTSDNSTVDTPDSMLQNSGLFTGMGHPWLPFTFATAVTVRQISPMGYEFPVEFEGRGKPGDSPLDEPPEVRLGFTPSEEAVDVTVEGKPMVYITGEQPEPPVKDTVYDMVLRVRRNVAWVDPDVMSRYMGAVNADRFLNLPPGTCRMIELEASSKRWDNFTYFDAAIGVQVRRGVPGLYDDSKAWYKRVLAAGYFCSTFIPNKDPNKKAKIVTTHATDATGAKVSKPILHEIQQGFRMQFDPDSGLQDPTQAQWYEWLPRTRPLLPFSVLTIQPTNN